MRDSEFLGYGLNGIWIYENTHNLVIRKNVELDANGSAYASAGVTPSPTSFVDHSVFNSWNEDASGDGAYRYSQTESCNIFEQAPWSFTTSSTDQVIGSPACKCGSSCGNGTAAGDDDELATNPNGIGIDLSPANQQYRPA